MPVDVTWPDGNIDPTLIEQAITPRTRAIVPVHLYGKPAAMRMIQQIAQRHGLALLEDAAQAHGAKIGSHRVGTFGQAAAFSFYPGKNLGALADGGAVVTDDEHLDSRLRALRNYGMRERYHHDTRGFNSRIDEFQAAFLRAKLVKLDAWNARRCEVANRYMEHLEPIDAIECQQPENDFQHVWHLFVVCVKDRDSFERYLGECGIDVLIHYPIPPHRSGAYADAFGAWNTRLPVSERMAAAALSLPMGPHVTDAHIDRVLIAIHNFLEGTATVLNRGSST